VDDRDDRRAAALARIATKREFRTHVLVYCAVNILLVVIWAASGGGSFWPIWVIAGWGIGLGLHGWQVYGQKPISEADIVEEMHRLGEPPDHSTP